MQLEEAMEKMKAKIEIICSEKESVEGRNNELEKCIQEINSEIN